MKTSTSIHKLIFAVFLFGLFPNDIMPQMPNKMSYQAVVRNNSNVLVTNTQIGMEINIRQSSPTGTIVYTETQTPTTNANGLVNIEIGGTAFSTIDWSAGPYFLETKTAITPPLTNYTIIGTSQILSVPYAQYAKTAESLKNEIIENDPVFKKSPSFGISDNYITNWNNAYEHSTNLKGSVHGSTTVGGNLLRLTNPSETSYLRINADNSVSTISGSTLRSEIGAGTGTVTNLSTNNGISGGPITTTGTLGLTGQALALHNLSTNGLITRTNTGMVTARTITAGDGITITNGDGVSGNPTISAKTYKIGDFAHGGIIFFLDESKQHGLVCAKTDLSTSMRWYAGTNVKTCASGLGIMTGKTNTAIIIAAHAALGDDGNNYAARICYEYSTTENGIPYYGWHLPSIGELTLMSYHKQTINATAVAHGGTAFAPDYYLSSSEESDSVAWGCFPGSQTSVKIRKDRNCYVRAVREF